MQEKNSELCQSLMRRIASFRTERDYYQPTWDLITEYVLPSRGVYINTDAKSNFGLKSKRRFESSAILAARTLTARILAEMTPTGSRWFDYRVNIPEIDSLDTTRRFLQGVSDRVYSILNTPSFKLAHAEFTADWVAYGTSCLYEMLEDEVFRSVPVQQIFLSEDKFGQVDTVFRHYKQTLRQVEQLFGVKDLPEAWISKLQTSPDEEVEIWHCVFPNTDYKSTSPYAKNFRYHSVYMTENQKKIFHTGNFKNLPYRVARFWKRSGEVYGGSPAVDALADIRILNTLEEADLRQQQLEGFPPLLVAHDSVVAPMKVVPNGIIYGGLSQDGKRLIDRVLPPNSGRQVLELKLEQKRQVIRSAFFVDPLINRENSIRTAAEVAKRGSEEMIGFAPFLNRYEAEYLSPLLDSLLNHVIKRDNLEIPPELDGTDLKIEYTAPLAKTQRAQELNNQLQFLQIVQQLASVNKDILMSINFDAVINSAADLLSVPRSIIVPPEIVEAMKQQKAEQEKAAADEQSMNEATDQMASLAKAGLINADDM